ncbi:hypothetical protein WNZ14_21990 [Hoeflea sp. AS60]|uniref:hypothetical protein n=1 Tax=Hoeflea sp. AS60 TaxID=3135780 RepID=UPI00316B16A7
MICLRPVRTSARMRLLMLSAVTRINRHTAMREIDDIVVSCGGWIEEHTLFSDIAATYRFVLPAGRLEAFAGRIDALGVRIDAASRQALAARAASGEGGQAQVGAEEVSGALSVTFICAEPDQRREIPSVPG